VGRRVPLPLAAAAVAVVSLLGTWWLAPGPEPAPPTQGASQPPTPAVDLGPLGPPAVATAPRPAPARPARLRIAAFPWAEVEVDGGQPFFTPRAQALELAPGRHRVELRHPTYGQVRRSVELAEGQELTLRHVFDAARPR
jgi:hypothetical protein